MRFTAVVFTTALILVHAVNVFAQLDNRFLSDHVHTNANDSGKVWFNFSHFNYLRNTEYFNRIEEGRTLFGTQLMPTLHYQPHSQLLIRAGAYMRSEFGASPSIYEVLPVIAMKLYNKQHNFSFTLGTLEGALSHQLIEPLFDVNSAILRRIENGAQFKINSNKVFSDTWINWEKFIEPGSPFKEQLTAGTHQYVNIYSANQSFIIRPVVQGTAFHRGGQIDSDTSPMITVMNYAAGLQLIQSWYENANEFRAEGYYTGCAETTNSGQFPFRSGNGLMLNAGVRVGPWSLLTTYWQGNSWIAPRGTTIYQSVSSHDFTYTEKNRQLIIPRICYQTRWLDDLLQCVARLEPVHDLSSAKTEFSFSLYLSYNLRYLLNR
jgi:hypothetical protein